MLAFTIHGRLPSLNEVIGANRANKYGGASLKKQAEALILPQLPRVTQSGKCHVTFRWHCPNTRRDPDNIASAQKFILDAMQSAGIIDNDGWRQVASLNHTFTVAGTDYVEVELTDA